MFLQIPGGLECLTTAIVWAFVGFLSSVRACMTLQAIPCSKGLITAFNSTLKGLFSRVRSFVDLVKTQVSIWSKIAGSFRVHDPRESQVRHFEGQTFDKKLRVVFECMTCGKVTYVVSRTNRVLGYNLKLPFFPFILVKCKAWLHHRRTYKREQRTQTQGHFAH